MALFCLMSFLLPLLLFFQNDVAAITAFGEAIKMQKPTGGLKCCDFDELVQWSEQQIIKP